MMTGNANGSWKLGLLVAASVISTSIGLGGCALVLGIEKRTEAGPVDEKTGKSTSFLCIDYCDAVMKNCTGDYAVFAARESCINICNALPPGSSAEPSGNTVECRLRRANSAEGSPEEFCAAAGPGGDGGCGSNCEAWCYLMESECSEDYDLLSDCMASCRTVPDVGGFDVEDSYAKDDIQCRLIHLGAVADDPIHCEHARYVAESQCVPPQDGAADCGRYCDIVMGNCFDDPDDEAVRNAVYDSRGECMAACEAFPLGELSDRTENTVGCRIYHGTASADDPAVHCDHAGPTGDGHCGAELTGGRTGNCESHCLLLRQGCPDEFDADFADVEECTDACVDEFNGNGAEDDAYYHATMAPDSDTLQCRTYYAVKAVDGDSSACEKAVLDGSCD